MQVKARPWVCDSVRVCDDAKISSMMRGSDVVPGAVIRTVKRKRGKEKVNLGRHVLPECHHIQSTLGTGYHTFSWVLKKKGRLTSDNPYI